MLSRIVITSMAASLAVLLSCSEQNDSEEAQTSEGQRQAAESNITSSASDSTYADSLLAAGQKFWNAAEYDSAVAYLQKAGRRYEDAQNWEKLVICYNALGGAYRAKRQIEPAMHYLQRALAIGLERLGDEHPAIAETHQALGIINAIMRQTEKAEYEFKRALEIYEKSLGENDPKVGNSHQNLGNLSVILGKFDTAIEHYEEALAIRQKNFGENHVMVAEACFALATGYRFKGYLDKSLELSQRALAIYLATIGENRPEVSRLYMNMGNAFGDMADYEQALIHFQKALEISRSLFGEQHDQSAGLIANIGGAYHLAGEYRKAITYLEKAGTIYENMFGSGHSHVANNHSNLGKVYLAMGNIEAARERYDKALRGFQDAFGMNHIEVANTYRSIGHVLRQKRDFAAAIDAYKKALPIYHRNVGEHHPNLAECYNGLAETYTNLKNFERAVSLYDQALAANSLTPGNIDTNDVQQIQNVLSQIILVETLSGKARMFAAKAQSTAANLEDWEKAISHYQQASDVTEKLRRSYKSEGSKFNLSAKALEIYDGGIETALQSYRNTLNPDDLGRAFDFVEKSRGGILLDALSEADAKQFAGIPNSLIEKEKQFRIDLAFYDRSLAEEKLKGAHADSSNILLWQDRLFALKQDYDALLQRFEHDFPEYYDLKYQSKTVTVQELRQQVLDENTALVEYFSGADSVFIFTITQRDFDIFSVAKNASFIQQIEQLRKAIIERSGARYVQAASSLYQNLLAPVAGKLEAGRLIIVPDAELSAVPFEVLLTGPHEMADSLRMYQQLPYLIDKFTISYAYSATLLAETLKRERAKPELDYIALAPVFPAGIPAGTRGDAFVKRSLKADSVRSSDRRFGYLPASRDEVRGILEVFKNTYGFFDNLIGGKSRLLIEREAGEEQLKSTDLLSFRYLHFATHGFVNETNPELSGLILAQDTTSSEDGILHLGEIYNLNLNADLVVLSACETGLGKIAKGEGIIGLTRGFLYAGAQNLLVSLWQVNDATTADLMVEFYRNMLGGMSKAESLRQAKLSLIQSHPEYAKPYYWAPFVLVGR